MKSLDPRVERLPEAGQPGPIAPQAPLDQFGTFEVFVQPKAGKPFQHEGIVHAPNLEMAFILAKETFTRRFTCVSLCEVETSAVFVSPTTEGDANAYDLLEDQAGSLGLVAAQQGEEVEYEIYHLPKRGKQHIHAGKVKAARPQKAMAMAKKEFNTGKIVYNIWAIRTSDIRFTTPEEEDLWATLPDKKFRDAAAYKGGEKLKNFLTDRSHSIN